MSREIFVGRKEELARGEAAVERALSGQGTLLLFSGEAGLGKTRVAQVVASAAAARGARVVWGRAWEAGGAPSYWPWIQVFRALGAADDPFAAQDETAGGVDVPQARFARFDRAARWLKKESQENALVVVLDDLHAADVSSLLFLHFLARDIRGCRLLLLGTYREVEARLSGEVGPLLAKIAREGDAIGLARLSRQDVLAWVSATSGASEGEAERVYRATEGNALFVHELLRVRGTTSAVDEHLGLRAILDEHLGRVSKGTRDILEIGSVLGRDLDAGLVAAIAARPIDQVETALREAREAGLVTSLTGGLRLSFAHILLRERLYAQLMPSRKAALHAAAAERILETGGDLATATHHLFESSSPPEHVAKVALETATKMLAKLAFEDATLVCERALGKYQGDDRLTFDLENTLGESLMRSGKLAAGREACLRAVARAKRMGSPELETLAALVYSTEILTGTVDPTMVAILRAALAGLSEEDSPLRARALARYAAALVPPQTREQAADVLVRSDAAVAMARRTGDPDTLLYALHYGGSASGYLVPSRKRWETMRELFALAESLGRRLVMLNVSGWWVVELREHGAPGESEAALEAYARLVEDFPQAHYRWRIPMLRATFASLEGDFAAAEALSNEALAIGEAGEIRAASVAWALNRVSIAHLLGDPSSMAPDAERVGAILARMTGAKGFLVWLYAAAGRHEEARRLLPDLMQQPGNFPWALVTGETVCLLGDRTHAEGSYRELCMHAGANSFFWGPFGSVAFGPTARVAGDVARLLGRTDDARRWYQEAIALGERMRAPGIVSLARKRLGELGAPSAGPKTTASNPQIEMHREGEMWRVHASTGSPIHLKHTKGLQYLADLLSRPGCELHVTQLSELVETPGDAGAVLDDRAKRQYKDRVDALREQLDEARRFGDPTRAARIEEEIEAIADQLAAAMGLGGRDRKMGSHVQRLRINVQRRLRDAIQRIEEHDPALGRYLTATVQTGVFCVFQPL